jgi:transposase InsO family protein
MSKARLVITAVITEKRGVREVARDYGVARSWIYALLARYQAEGEAAFEPRSRRPKSSPRAIAEATAGLIVRLRKELAGQGLDAGPHTICWHLRHHHQLRVSPATISRYLTRAGLVTLEPSKRPKSSYIRFAAEQPNECWQADFTHYPLAGGTGTEHGTPASTLTDNGMVFTTRFSGRRGGRNGLENELRRLGVKQKNGKANHPQTQGKAERFQQTLKKWLAAQHPQPATLAQLQALTGTFTAYYNTRRPHRSLAHRSTPAVAYAARPKAGPSSRAADTHDRVRTDVIDTNGVVTLRHAGRLYHVGVGRTHARTHVIMLVQDLHIRIVDAATGELLRQLTLDPARNYQPTGKPRRPPGTPRKRSNPEP